MAYKNGNGDMNEIKSPKNSGNSYQDDYYSLLPKRTAKRVQDRPLDDVLIDDTLDYAEEPAVPQNEEKNSADAAAEKKLRKLMKAERLKLPMIQLMKGWRKNRKKLSLKIFPQEKRQRKYLTRSRKKLPRKLHERAES